MLKSAVGDESAGVRVLLLPPYQKDAVPPRHRWACFWRFLWSEKVRSSSVWYCMHCGRLEDPSPSGYTATDSAFPCIRTPLDEWVRVREGAYSNGMYVLQTTWGTATVQHAWKGKHQSGLVLEYDQWRWEAYEHYKPKLDVEKGWGFCDTLDEAMRQAEAFYRPVWAPGPV